MIQKPRIRPICGPALLACLFLSAAFLRPAPLSAFEQDGFFLVEIQSGAADSMPGDGAIGRLRVPSQAMHAQPTASTDASPPAPAATRKSASAFNHAISLNDVSINEEPPKASGFGIEGLGLDFNPTAAGEDKFPASDAVSGADQGSSFR
jgi:hypothetical protein